MIQHGMMNRFMDTLPGLGIELLGYSDDFSKSLKVSSHVEESSADIMDIGWRHFYPVIYLLLTGFIVAFVILTAEKLMSVSFESTQKPIRKYNKTLINGVVDQNRLNTVYNSRPRIY